MNPDTHSPRIIPPSRRRDKPIISCQLCRKRSKPCRVRVNWPSHLSGTDKTELKCDRQQPCKTCTDRGLSLSCTYVRNTAASHEPKIPNSVHERINQLEKLVTTLMSGKDVDQPSPSVSIMSHMDQFHGDTEEIPGTPDRVKLGDDTTSYTNSGHWTSILDGVRVLLSLLHRTLKPYRSQSWENIWIKFLPQVPKAVVFKATITVQICSLAAIVMQPSKNYWLRYLPAQRLIS